MKLGFIGVGNMAGALLSGLVTSGSVNPENIFVSGSNKTRLEYIAKTYSVNIADSNVECVQKSDVVFLGVKPDITSVVGAEVFHEVHDKTLVSMASKISMSELVTYYGTSNIIRIMPNLNVTILRGVTAIVRNDSVSDLVYEFVKKLMLSLGSVEEIDESMFSGLVGIAGSSPAFVFRFIEQLIQPSLSEGFTYDEALRIACDAVSGSAEYLKQSGLSPSNLIDSVSSPNGATIQGTKVLDVLEFDNAVQSAVTATIRKDKGID